VTEHDGIRTNLTDFGRLDNHAQAIQKRPGGPLIADPGLLISDVSIQQSALRTCELRLGIQHFKGGDGAEFVFLLLRLHVFPRQIPRPNGGLNGGVREIDGIQRLLHILNNLLLYSALVVTIARAVHQRVGQLTARRAESVKCRVSSSRFVSLADVRRSRFAGRRLSGFDAFFMSAYSGGVSSFLAGAA
jgi:hypothetical protein